ncbi:GNAT family N-acetyltransferase [Polluticaenibacter yanchengensis]|uniref:GNAT family N-acetyltransferase n=1 Tax=Polluticaenibacter yanchengensis TaxID=3014562 RepID=A0ABT4UKN7_9BACT|nr:GNAT family N-acetyltransferase [Chitinophagaceae bacterium LY-5]
MATVQIVKASNEDIIAIQKIAAATWPVTYNAILSAKQLSYMLNKMYNTEVIASQMNTTGNQFFLAVLDGQPIGFCHVAVSEQSHTYKLHKLYVLPTIQKTGAGITLMQTAEDFAREHGATNLILNVNRHNNAFGFYKKHGFEILRSEDVDIGRNFFMNDYVLIKSL